MSSYESLKQQVKALATASGMSIQDFLNSNGISASSFFQKRKKGLKRVEEFLGLKEEKNILENDIIEYLDKNESENVHWKELFDHFQKHQNLTDRMSNGQVFATIKIETDRDNIAIATSADWHMGSSSVDYASFGRNIDYISNTDGMYVLCVGDYRDNFVKFRTASCILDQIMGPKEQTQLLASILEEFKAKNKVLAMTWGNHDDNRDEQNTGFSIVQHMFGDDFVYFDGMGVLNLEIINKKRGTTVSYSIVMSHVGKGYSMYNENHGQRRLYKEFYPGDVVVTAHKHTPAFQYTQMYSTAADQGKEFGGEAWFIQTGTFKTKFDAFSNRYFGRGISGMPTILLSTTEKSVQVMKNPELCESFLK